MNAKFAGRRMNFAKDDLGAAPGSTPSTLSPRTRARLAAEYPKGVRFTRAGYPIFTPYAIKRLTVEGLTGDRQHDRDLTNEAAKLPRTPRGYVWHHVEDGRTMELVPSYLHRKVSHTGGAVAIPEGQAGHVAPGGVPTRRERAASGSGAAGGATAGGPAAAEGGE